MASITAIRSSTNAIGSFETRKETMEMQVQLAAATTEEQMVTATTPTQTNGSIVAPSLVPPKTAAAAITTTAATTANGNGNDDNLLALAAADAMNQAMALLPDELTAEYREACRWTPELVEKESNPWWFLSFHPNDPLAAALRLANYWKKRKEIFQERALLPINLSGSNKGALTADDVRILRTGYAVNLPRDKKGRSVLYFDNSKKRPEDVSSTRIIFFFGQCLMENEKTRTDGFVGLYNISNPYAADFVQKNNECAAFLIKECMPVKQYTLHLFYMSPPGRSVMQLFINTVFSWAVNFLSFYFGKSIFAHVASRKEDCLAHLLKYEFSPEGLPVALGGYWTGGCEPWRRKGPRPRGGGSGGSGGSSSGEEEQDDELNLDIETDLTCLLRNSLWLHNQTLSSYKANEELSDGNNEQQQEQQQLDGVAANASTTAGTAAAASASDAAVVAHSPIVGEPRTIARRGVRCKRQGVSQQENASQGQRRRGKTTKESTKRQRVRVSSSNSAATLATTAVAAAGAEKTQPDEEEEPLTAEEKKARRRRMHAEADRVRRAKERIEIEVLQEQVLAMIRMNQSLMEEHQRLEGLARAAIAMTTTQVS